MISQRSVNSIRALSAALLLVSAVPCQAQTATDGSIREFFTASGQEAQLVEGMQTILPMLRQMSKDMPEELFRELTRTDKVADTVIPIYRRHFSEEEMRELIAFYKTPIGTKYAKLAGKIQREGMELNARQGQAAVINYQVQKGKFTIEPAKK